MGRDDFKSASQIARENEEIDAIIAYYAKKDAEWDAACARGNRFFEAHLEDLHPIDPKEVRR